MGIIAVPVSAVPFGSSPWSWSFTLLLLLLLLLPCTRHGLLRRAGAPRLPCGPPPPHPQPRGRAAPHRKGRRHEVVSACLFGHYSVCHEKTLGAALGLSQGAQHVLVTGAEPQRCSICGARRVGGLQYLWGQKGPRDLVTSLWWHSAGKHRSAC